MSKKTKEQPIVFVHALGKTTLNPEVKNWTYEQIKKTYEGVLDYESLAKQLGISPKGKPESKPDFKSDTEKEK